MSFPISRAALRLCRALLLKTAGLSLVVSLSASAPVNGRSLQPAPASLNTLTAAERAEGWIVLFDGKSTSGWRNYQSTSLSSGWSVKDGALALDGGKGGDIVHVTPFADFELVWEWKISPNGNSGLFWHANENHPKIFHSAHEYQMVDNDGEKWKARSATEKAGSEYFLYETDPHAFRGAEKWNLSRIVVRGDSVAYYLNGVQTVAYQEGSPDWNRRVAGTKFAKWPDFAKPDRGLIGLQDHGDSVMVRNMKLRELR